MATGINDTTIFGGCLLILILIGAVMPFVNTEFNTNVNGGNAYTLFNKSELSARQEGATSAGKNITDIVSNNCGNPFTCLFASAFNFGVNFSTDSDNTNIVIIFLSILQTIIFPIIFAYGWFLNIFIIFIKTVMILILVKWFRGVGG